MDGLLAPLFAVRPDGGELTLRRRFRQPMEKVWAAISIPERIAAWMGVDWLGDAELSQGAAFDYRFRAMDIVTRGRVLRFEPPFVLEHGWHDNRPPGAVVRWELSPDGDGTVLTLTHVFRKPEDAARTGAGWTDLLDALSRSLGDAVTERGFFAVRDDFTARLPPQALRDGRRISVDGAPSLRFQRFLPHGADAVWAALVEPAALKRWLQAEAVVDGRAGGRFQLRLHGAAQPMQGKVLRWDAPRLLEYTWPEKEAHGDSVVRWEIAAAPGGCLLTLTHIFRAGGELADFASGWHWHLDALDGALLGEARAFDHEEWTVLRKVYGFILQG
jgi:uncharacterized protein YndB with AHSA1/START domain